MPWGSHKRKSSLVLGTWLSLLSLQWYLKALLPNKDLRA